MSIKERDHGESSPLIQKMSRTIEIQTGARLHFGLLAVLPSSGRHFGGVGLMIASPGCHLVVEASERDECIAAPEIAARLATWRDEYRQRRPARYRPQHCRLQLSQAIPMHAGLGSGTQTALALAASLAALGGEENVSVAELARRVGRGTRSALGTYGFQCGGLLIESGKLQSEEISPLVARLEFPPQWRMLLVVPNERHGLSGDAERAVFAKLQPMPSSLTDSLCRIVLMELLPAVATADFAATSESLHEFGQLNGSYFSPVQHGVFSDPQVAEIAKWLFSNGVTGIGQSSWGPTLFVLCRDQAEAESLQRDIQKHPAAAECTIYLTAALNTGATILQSA